MQEEIVPEDNVELFVKLVESPSQTVSLIKLATGFGWTKIVATSEYEMGQGELRTFTLNFDVLVIGG